MTQMDTQSPRRYWPRRVGFALIAILGLMIAAAIIVILWIGSGSGRNFVENRLESTAFAGQRVEIDGLEGSVLSAFKIAELRLSDEDGVWLEARDIRVDWTPRALLSKTLIIDAASARVIDVMRRPILPESDEKPRLQPLDTIRINDAELANINLAAPVLGRELTLTLSASGAHRPDGGTATLQLSSTRGDVANADVDWSSDLVLSGDADIEGPASGLIAQLLRLSDDQDMTARITTQGNQTEIKAQIAGVDALSGAITRGADAAELSANFVPSSHPLGQKVAAILGGPTIVSVRWPYKVGEALTLKVDAPDLSFKGQGTRQDSGAQFDSAAIDMARPLRGITTVDAAIERFNASGQAEIGRENGALRLRFDGQVDAADLRYGRNQIDRLFGPATLNFADDRLAIDTKLTGRTSEAMALADRATLDTRADINLNRKAINLSRANIALPGFNFVGSGAMNYGGESMMQSASLSGRYDIQSSIFYAGPSARLRGQAEFGGPSDQPTLRILGRAENLKDLPEAALPLMGAAADYQARLVFADGQVRIRSAKLTTPNLTVTGQGRWQNAAKTLNANLSYAVENYEFQALNAAGIRGTVDLKGPAQNIEFENQTDLANITIGALSLTDNRVEADGRYASGKIIVDVIHSAKTDEGPVNASAKVTLSGAQWRVEALSGSLGELTAQGALSGQGGDLAALRGEVRLQGRYAAIPAEMIEADIRLADAQVNAEATISGVNTDTFEDVTVTLSAQGPRDAVAFNVQAAGDVLVQEISRALDAAANGQADLASALPSLSADFQGELGRQSLSGSLSAAQTDDGWSGEVTAEALGGNLGAALTPGAAGQFSFNIDGIKNSDVLLLIGRPVAEGVTSGAGTFNVVNGAIVGEAVLSVADLRTPGSNGQPISFELDLALADEQLRAALTAQDDGLDGRVEVAGPVTTYDRAPFLKWPPDQALNGTANLNGNIGPLVELFLPPLTDVSGVIDTTMSFTVPATPDALIGTVAITQGEVEQGTIGLHLVDLAINADLKGEIIEVTQLSAKGKSGGSLNGSGRMGLGEGTGSVKLTAKKLRVVSRREGYANVSGELALSRTTELLRLSGNLDVTDAEIDIARLPKPGLPTLEVTFEGGDIDEDAEDTPLAAPPVTEIDLSVRSTGPINVKGRGLDALMSVRAQIGGAFDNPAVSGVAEIDRGRFSFLGKRFEFRDSSVTIMDDIMESRLNMEAVRETADLTAVVELTGTLSRPEIELSAEPELPSDEVLSRILFGRSPTQLSALETARLAAALTQLSGGSGLDLVGSLENAVGLDTLDIGQTTSGQTQLTTGKYLSDDVYLEVRSTAAGAPGIAVEWQARKNVSVEAETVPGESQSVSVQWKKDFD